MPILIDCFNGVSIVQAIDEAIIPLSLLMELYAYSVQKKRGDDEFHTCYITAQCQKFRFFNLFTYVTPVFTKR
jgi:hypothetical protein